MVNIAFTNENAREKMLKKKKYVGEGSKMFSCWSQDDSVAQLAISNPVPHGNYRG